MGYVRTLVPRELWGIKDTDMRVPLRAWGAHLAEGGGLAGGAAVRPKIARISKGREAVLAGKKREEGGAQTMVPGSGEGRERAT